MWYVSIMEAFINFLSNSLVTVAWRQEILKLKILQDIDLRHRSAGIPHCSWRMHLLKVSLASYLTDNEVLFPIKKQCDREVQLKYTETMYMAQRYKSRMTRFINYLLNVCLGFLNTEWKRCFFTTTTTTNIKRWALIGPRLWLDLFETKSNLAMSSWPCQTRLRAASSVRWPHTNPWVQLFFLKHCIFCHDHLLRVPHAH